MGLMRATRASYIRSGDQAFSTMPGMVLPDDHWAVGWARQHYVSGEPPLFEPVTDDETRAVYDANGMDGRALELHGMRERFGDDRSQWPAGQRQRAENLERGIQRDATDLEYRAETERRRGAVAQRAGLGYNNTESGDGARNDGPQVMRRVDPWDASPGSLGARQVRDRALKVLESRDHTRHLEGFQLDQVDRLLRTRTDNCNGEYIARMMLLSENDHYRTAFRELITKPQPILDPEQVAAVRAFQEFRAMSIGTDAAGGFGLPVLIDSTIILTAQGSPNDILNIARVETITTDEWKGVSSAGVSWSFDAEAAEVSDDSPTLAQPNVVTHKAQGFLPYSLEVGQDYPNFAAEMSTLLSEGYSELVAEKLTTGSGTGEPWGVVTRLDATTTSEVAPTTDGAFGAVDLYKLWDALPIKYRRRPATAWMSSTDVMNEVRNFGTTLGSNFTVDLTDESIPRLFNRRYYENDFLSDFTGTTGASALLILGDWRGFLVAQRAGMSVELVPHLLGSNRRPSGQRGLYAWARIGSDVVNTNGFRLLVNS